MADTTAYKATLDALGITTADQIKAFQKQYGLIETGEFGETEQAAYNKYGALPYKTAAAIKEYQQKRGIDSTGEWDTSTQTAYKKDLAAEGSLTDVDDLAARVMERYDLPTTDAEKIKENVASYLRQSVEQAIGSRKKQTAANRAAIDLDAYSRGVGASTWVTDAKQRETDSEADDIGTMESNYSANLNEAVQNQLQSAMANKLTAQNNAYTLALQLYNLGQLTKQNVGQSSSGGGGGGGYYVAPKKTSSGGGGSSYSSASTSSDGLGVWDSTNPYSRVDTSQANFANKDMFDNYMAKDSTSSKTSTSPTPSKKATTYDSSKLNSKKVGAHY